LGTSPSQDRIIIPANTPVQTVGMSRFPYNVTNNSCAACKQFRSVRAKTMIRNRTGTWCDLAVTEYLRASGTAQHPLRPLGCTRPRPQRVLHTATLELKRSVQYYTPKLAFFEISPPSICEAPLKAQQSRNYMDFPPNRLEIPHHGNALRRRLKILLCC
jgi:hypothetical protein